MGESVFHVRRMAAVKTPAPIRAEPPAMLIIRMIRGFVTASRALAARSAYAVALITASITKVDPKMRTCAMTGSAWLMN